MHFLKKILIKAGIFLLGTVFPGTGQLMCNKIFKACLFFGIWSVLWILHISWWWTVPAIVAGIDAAIFYKGEVRDV
jgi:TM2 domain-containing membrane protein YozV